MNKFQLFCFIVSLSYIFYVLWFKYKKENFFDVSRLFINIFLCTMWATFGLIVDFSVQSASFLMPILLVILIRIFDAFSVKIRNRHFFPRSQYDQLSEKGNINDAWLTLVVLLLVIIVPIVMLNLIINSRIFD